MNRDYHKLPRLYLTSALNNDAAILLNMDQWHYLRNVLRMVDGEQLMVFNGVDGEWLAELIFETKKRAVIKPIKQTKVQTLANHLTYAFAPIKKGRLDYMVQKATELGVGILQPVITEHTVSHKLKLEKLEANAVEAAEQCTMLSIPKINPTIKFDVFLNDFSKNYHIIFCDEAENSSSPIAQISALKDRKICLLIGPEGGFSEQERRQLLAKNNVTAISLGPRIMRADTAAIAALTLIQASIGDW